MTESPIDQRILEFWQDNQHLDPTYRVFLSIMCPKSARKQQILSLYYAGCRAGMSKKLSMQCIGNILLVSKSTIVRALRGVGPITP